MLKTAVNSERKYYDRGDTQDGITYSAPYAFHPFDGLALGNDEITRNGDQVKALYSTLRLHLENIVTSTDDGTAPQSSRLAVRIMAVLDMGSRYDAAIAASTMRSMMLSTPGDGRGSIMSPYKVGHIAGYGSVGDRFKILRDKVVTLDLQKQSQYMYKTTINWSRSKIKGLRIKYSEFGEVTNPNQPDPRLYFLVWTDSTVANLRCRVVCRTQFVDN